MFGTRSSMISTRSTLTKFLLGRFHFTLCCRFCTDSFLHLDQKTFEKYWMPFHLLRRQTSVSWKLPGGGITTLDFRVSTWLGVSGSELRGSPEGVESGWLLRMHSTLVNNVLNDSSSRVWPYSRIRDDRIDGINCIWRSQAHPYGTLQVDSVSIRSPNQQKSMQKGIFELRRGPSLPNLSLTCSLLPRYWYPDLILYHVLGPSLL